MTKSKGAEAPTYRVIMPMVQILGHIPFAGRHQVHERTLYRGDVIPGGPAGTPPTRSSSDTR